MLNLHVVKVKNERRSGEKVIHVDEDSRIVMKNIHEYWYMRKAYIHTITPRIVFLRGLPG